MLKQKLNKIKTLSRTVRLAGLALIIAIGMTGGIVRADQYQSQIQQLESQNANKEQTVSDLQIKASSYQDAISKLQARIDAIQQQITSTQTQQAIVRGKIASVTKQLAYEKSVLGDAIKTMYLEGQTSTLEVLLSSNNLSDFVNQEQYHLTVENNIVSLVNKITVLKAQLKTQDDRLTSLLKDQKGQQNALALAQGQQNQLLNLNQQQQSAYNQQIQANNAKISQLEAEELAAHQRLASSGSVSITSSGSCGGGYPSNATGQNGNWGCVYGLDGAVDPWNLYNQECVSYTAWKVYQAYGYMPDWGVYPANADNWPGLADSYGIPRGSTPKVGSVAVGTDPSWFGPVGHVMWVEAISGNQILVSQMNFSGPGQYSTMWISTSLISTYIYFGQSH